MNVVRKYGKNSIDSQAKANAVARHLAETRKPGDSMVVVVSCVYSVDPKLYPGAKRLPIVTYEDMMELAALGTGPLEVRSVELARRYDVHLFITEALGKDHSRGTYIMNDSVYMKDMAVTGISTADNYTIATVSDMKNKEKAVAAFGRAFEL